MRVVLYEGRRVRGKGEEERGRLKKVGKRVIFYEVGRVREDKKRRKGKRMDSDGGRKKE